LNTLSTRVDSLSSSIEGWKLINVRKTERGYKKVYFKAIKVWRRQNKLPCEKPVWLLISKDLESNEIKYSLCNASEDTSLDELAKMQSSRYWIERAFQDAKGNCGMAEYILHSAGRHQILRIFTDIVFETLFNFMFSSKLVNI
jgi:SRSO17 transposase